MTSSSNSGGTVEINLKVTGGAQGAIEVGRVNDAIKQTQTLNGYLNPDKVRVETFAFYNLDEQIKKTAQSETKLAESIKTSDKALGSSTETVNKTVAAKDKAEKGTSQLAWKMQMAGYQIQDFFTQVGAGTPVLQALSQQLPQLLGAFGPTGAIVGAGVAVGALVLKFAGVNKELDNIVSKADDAKKAMEKISEANASEGAKKLVEQISLAQVAESSLKQTASDHLDIIRSQEEAQKKVAQVKRDTAILELELAQKNDGFDRSGQIAALKGEDAEIKRQEEIKATQKIVEDLIAKQQTLYDQSNEAAQKALEWKQIQKDSEAKKSQLQAKQYPAQQQLADSKRFSRSDTGELLQGVVDNLAMTSATPYQDAIDRINNTEAEQFRLTEGIDRIQKGVTEAQKKAEAAKAEAEKNASTSTQLYSQAVATTAQIEKAKQQTEASQKALEASQLGSQRDDLAKQIDEKTRQVGQDAASLTSANAGMTSNIEAIKGAVSDSHLTVEDLNTVGSSISQLKNETATATRDQIQQVSEMQSDLRKADGATKITEVATEFKATSKVQSEAIAELQAMAKDGFNAEEIKKSSALLGLLRDDINSSFSNQNKTIDEILTLVSQIKTEQIRQDQVIKGIKSLR